MFDVKQSENKSFADSTRPPPTPASGADVEMGGRRDGSTPAGSMDGVAGRCLITNLGERRESI